MTQPHLTVPLREAPVDPFADERPRRCPNEDCKGVAILIDPLHADVEIEDAVRAHGRHHYACGTCGLPAPRPHGLHCPCCLAWMRSDSRGDPACPVCPARTPAPAEPRSAWELALGFNDGGVLPDEWGCNGSLEWSRYGTPAHVPSRLALRFGYEDRGTFHAGTDDTQHTLDGMWKAARIEALGNAIKAITAHAKGLADVPTSPKLPRTYRALAARTWPAYRQFLWDTVADLVNAITMRGGTFEDITDTVHVKRARSTPFAGYRHALRAALGAIDPEQEAPGRGMGSLGRGPSVEYTNKLPGGIIMQPYQKGGMSVHPSHAGASIASTSRGTREDDARSCLAAARIGGIWTPVEMRDDGTPAPGKAARVDGGEPLSAVARKLLELVELGAITGEDYARLPVHEALRRIQRAITSGEAGYHEARHLQVSEAKVMVRRARVASMEAFEAWGLIEKQAREPRPERAKDDDVDRPRRGVPLSGAHNPFALPGAAS